MNTRCISSLACRGIATLVALGAFVWNSASAQVVDPYGQQQALHQIEGSLENMRPGMLQVATISGTWIVGVGNGTVLNVTGTAEPGYLRTGQYVRFRGDFDSKGQPLAPITQLTIFTPRMPEDIGITSADFIDVANHAAQVVTGNARPGQPPSTTPTNPKGKTYQIAGRLTQLKDGQMQIDAGKPVRANLSKDAQLDLQIADLGVVSKGDRITVRGSYNIPGQMLGQEVIIELKEPLAPPPENKRVNARQRARNNRNAKNQVDPDSELKDPLANDEDSDGSGSDSGSNAEEADPFDEPAPRRPVRPRR